MGSNIAVPSGLMFPPAAIPRPPWIMAARSVMISPNMLSVTIIKPLRVLQEPHANGVNVGIFALDLRVVCVSDLIERPPPEIPGVSQHVGLATECQFTFAVRTLGVVKSMSQAAVYSFAGVHALLHCNLVKRAFAQEPTGGGI